MHLSGVQRWRRFSPGLGFVFLVGCGGNPTGIWLFQVEASEGIECETTIDNHNFLNVLDGENSEAWTIEESSDASSEIFFGQVLENESGGWALVLADRVLQGTLESGRWVFSWEHNEEGSGLSSHQSGYAFEHQWNQSSKTRVTRTVEKKRGSGSISLDTSDWQFWRETDAWGEQVGLSSGQIPAGDYLLVNRGGGEGGPAVEAASNRRDAPDCEGQECELEVSSDCDESQSYMATRYEVEEGVPVDFLLDASEEQGLRR
jgi:hypothetical protein